jgi:hypothetical protein
MRCPVLPAPPPRVGLVEAKPKPVAGPAPGFVLPSQSHGLFGFGFLVWCIVGARCGACMNLSPPVVVLVVCRLPPIHPSATATSHRATGYDGSTSVLHPHQRRKPLVATPVHSTHSRRSRTGSCAKPRARQPMIMIKVRMV